jgi:hypothetical protein
MNRKDRMTTNTTRCAEDVLERASSLADRIDGYAERINKRLREAEKDTARLNWIQKHEAVLHKCCGSWWCDSRRQYGQGVIYATARQAIDAAMRKDQTNDNI